ncbi:MAG TPA: hypothetical protein VHP14_01820 [Anaerolineales bacterium]|nr:hypothetical protein [Anaerolineales bacterium]
MDSKKSRIRWYILAQILLCIGLAVVAYGLTFNRTRVLGLQDQKNIANTKTAIANTAQALMGPFPTATMPTRTPTTTATVTPRSTATPTTTSSITPTASNTPNRFMSPTSKGSSGGAEVPPIHVTPSPKPATVEPPTEPPVDPTDPPVEPTEPPAEPTDPPETIEEPTNPPVSP